MSLNIIYQTDVDAGQTRARQPAEKNERKHSRREKNEIRELARKTNDLMQHHSLPFTTATASTANETEENGCMKL